MLFRDSIGRYIKFKMHLLYFCKIFRQLFAVAAIRLLFHNQIIPCLISAFKNPVFFILTQVFNLLHSVVAAACGKGCECIED